MRTLAMVAALVAALCASGNAAASEPAWYGGVAAGRFWPDADSGNGPKKKLDPGPIGELRVGLRAPLDPIGLAVELAVGGFNVEGPMPAVDVTETELQSLSATWLATTVKGWHRLGHDRLRAFAGLGVAYYTFDAGLKDPPSSRRDETETDLGAHLVAGLEFDVSPRFGLGLEDRWVSVKANESVFGNGNAAVYAASGNAVLLSAVFRF